MATLVGTQNNFDDAIISLIELEYDAIGAYKLAIEKIETQEYKDKLTEFLLDHQRHIQEIKNFYNNSTIKLPDSADLTKGLLAKLKVAAGNVMDSITDSDLSVLSAMLSNEEDTNTAYERMMQHPGQPQELKTIIQAAYNDEKKHYTWLNNTVKAK